MATATPAPTGDAPAKIGAAPAPLPKYEIQMDAKELRALERNAQSDQTHPATFVADGQTYHDVQVRFRGEWARSWPKKPFKIFFSRDQPFKGHHSINLNSAWRDASYVRETLAYHIYETCGVPASGSRVVSLHINGQFRGLYAEVEQVDKTLLRRFQLNGAELFKATSDNNQADERDHTRETSFASNYENETQKTNDLHELQKFCHELAVAPDASEFFNQHVELDKYINYLAATVLVQHWDGFNKNHFLVYDRRGSGKWLAWPWDLDRTLGDHWSGEFDRADLPVLLGTRQRPSVTGWNRLQDRFFSVPAFRAQFLKRLDFLLRQEFTEEKLFPLLDLWEAQLSGAAPQDRRLWPGPAEDLHRGIAGVKSFIKQRRAFLMREAAKLAAQTPP